MSDSASHDDDPIYEDPDDVGEIFDDGERPGADDADPERDIILAMCQAHDREEAAQKGEPTPWTEESEADADWVGERFYAMREAFDVAKAMLSASPAAPVGELGAAVGRLADIADWFEEGDPGTEGVEITDEWAERYCALVNQHPDGIQATSTHDGWVEITFRDKARNQIAAMLASRPTQPAAEALREKAKKLMWAAILDWDRRREGLNVRPDAKDAFMARYAEQFVALLQQTERR